MGFGSSPYYPRTAFIMSFKEKSYLLVKNVISDDLIDYLITLFALNEEVVYNTKNSSKNELKFNDPQVYSSFAVYGAYWTEALLLKFQPIIERVVEKKLYPTYSYARIYYKGSSLTNHTDRDACEYSVTLTLKVDGKDWPLFLKKDNEVSEVIIKPGDILIYKGIELPHWRDPMPWNTKEVYQVFLHYVDADGPSSGLKYDGRTSIGMPRKV